MSSASRIQSRWFSVMVLLTLIQFLCMLVPLWWFSGWLEEQFVQNLAKEAYPTVSAFTSELRWKGTTVAALLALLGGLLAATSVRRYERRLERVNGQLETLVERRSHALVKTRDATIFGLAKLAEWRDDETGGHLERIRSYVEILASELSKTHPDLDREAIRMLGTTSSLHDIGKVGIPDAVLLKPGRLTPEERSIIEKHPLIGGNCLMAIKEHLGRDDFLQVACEIALCHHERWDGSGYPYGLAGEQIPRAARIVALADVYDALTSKRVYKDAMSHGQARQIILEETGKHFDPAVVEAFEATEDRFYAITLRGRSAIGSEDHYSVRQALKERVKASIEAL